MFNHEKQKYDGASRRHHGRDAAHEAAAAEHAPRGSEEETARPHYSGHGYGESGYSAGMYGSGYDSGSQRRDERGGDRRHAHGDRGEGHRRFSAAEERAGGYGRRNGDDEGNRGGYGGRRGGFPAPGGEGAPQNGNPRFGGHGGGHGGFSIDSLIADVPDGHLLFVGAVNCARHRGFQMGPLMRAGRMSVLTPTAADYATGKYLNQITDAIREIHQERGTTRFVLMYGCQCAVLSTDFDIIKDELRADGIQLKVHGVCHLCRTDNEDEDWED